MQDKIRRTGSRPGQKAMKYAAIPAKEDRKENDRAKDPNLLVQPIGSVLRRNLQSRRATSSTGER